MLQTLPPSSAAYELAQVCLWSYNLFSCGNMLWVSFHVSKYRSAQHLSLLISICALCFIEMIRYWLTFKLCTVFYQNEECCAESLHMISHTKLLAELLDSRSVLS